MYFQLITHVKATIHLYRSTVQPPVCLCHSSTCINC